MALRRSQLAAALDEEYPSTFSRLQRMFRSRGIPAEEAADMAQETAARLLSYLDRRGDDAPDPGPLIHRIATNLMIDRARSHSRRVISLDVEGGDEPAAPDDPHEEVSRQHRDDVLWRAIHKLSVKQRLVIAMSLDGMNPAEIAVSLGIERNAVDALLHRGRRSLAGQLRSVREGLLAFPAILAAKWRAVMRRGVSTESAQLVAASPVVVNLASAALALALTAGTLAPEITLPAVAVSSIRPVPVPALPAPGSASATIADRTRSRTSVLRPRAHVVVDPRAHSVDVGADVHDPLTGETESTQVQLWQTRDDAERGITGPTLDSATNAACSIATSACGAPEGN